MYVPYTNQRQPPGPVSTVRAPYTPPPAQTGRIPPSSPPTTPASPPCAAPSNPESAQGSIQRDRKQQQKPKKRTKIEHDLLAAQVRQAQLPPPVGRQRKRRRGRAHRHRHLHDSRSGHPRRRCHTWQPRVAGGASDERRRDRRPQRGGGRGGGSGGGGRAGGSDKRHQKKRRRRRDGSRSGRLGEGSAQRSAGSRGGRAGGDAGTGRARRSRPRAAATENAKANPRWHVTCRAPCGITHLRIRAPPKFQTPNNYSSLREIGRTSVRRFSHAEGS